MPESLQALLIAVLAVLPGAVATFSFERYVGTYTADFPERVVRFIVGSALVFPLTAAFAWPLWTNVLHASVSDPLTGEAQFVNRLTTNDDLSPLWLLLPIGYVTAPACAGAVAGSLWAAWLRRQAGRGRALPDDLRAWDWAFLDRRPVAVVARLRTGGWVAGVFGPDSYASPKGLPSKDLYLEVALEVTNEGVLVLDETDVPIRRDSSVLLHGEDVEMFELIPIRTPDGG